MREAVAKPRGAGAGISSTGSIRGNWGVWVD